VTADEKIDSLTQIAAASLESIQALEPVTAAHSVQIGDLLRISDRHGAAIDRLTAAQAETSADVRELQATVRTFVTEWQAYLRRIPPQ
jgi:phage host-nuclease inhibitor protein Gam